MRFRLYPTPSQEALMREHCAHARFVYNLANEQFRMYRRAWGSTPGYLEQSRQLTEARAAFEWLANGSAAIQHQALRDFDQARRGFFNGTNRRPKWRKYGKRDGFRVSQWVKVRRVNKHWGEVQFPKVGWVRFRWSRQAPEARSYRVTLDSSGRWHVAFAVWPSPTIDGPGDGTIIGIDRGVAIPFACSDGRTFDVPGLSAGEARRLRLLQRSFRRCQKGSKRRERTRLAIAKLRAREIDRKKDVIEKATTELARTVDLLRLEELSVNNMTRSIKGTVDAPGVNVRAKAGLNRSIRSKGWGLFAQRLKEKAPGRVQLVPPQFTSQRCSVCGHVASESRESQARFRCVSCGHTANADLNAARNIAAGHAVTARGGQGAVRPPLNREPQLLLGGVVGILAERQGGCQNRLDQCESTFT